MPVIVQPVDELAVTQSSLAHGRVNADDPETTKISLPHPSIAKRIRACSYQRFLGRTQQIARDRHDTPSYADKFCAWLVCEPIPSSFSSSDSNHMPHDKASSTHSVKDVRFARAPSSSPRNEFPVTVSSQHSRAPPLTERGAIPRLGRVSVDAAPSSVSNCSYSTLVEWTSPCTCPASSFRADSACASATSGSANDLCPTDDAWPCQMRSGEIVSSFPCGFSVWACSRYPISTDIELYGSGLPAPRGPQNEAWPMCGNFTF